MGKKFAGKGHDKFDLNILKFIFKVRPIESFFLGGK
jgi:hypothetical protein